MTAIVGHLGLDPGHDDRIRLMLQCCAERAAFQPHIERIDDGTTGAFAAAGHATTTHSLHERSPIVHRSSGVILAADIRLDNRDELRPQLATTGHPIGDAELALLAYLRWGLTFPEHLLGDFAIAVFDPRSNEVLLVRDHLGVRPVLYAGDGNHLLFGSTLRSVRAGSDRDFPIYLDRLQHAMLDPLEVAEPTATFYKEISRVPAGSVLRWSMGSEPTIRRYWRAERGDLLRFETDQEYHEAYRELFDRTVSCRLESTRPVAAMLSGGLDSSAVVSAAQTMVEPLLRTYSFVEEDPGKGSDTPYVAACVAAMKLDPVVFTAAEIAAQFDLDEVLSDPDSVFDTEMGALWTTSRHMNETGYGVVLTGVGGDETVALNPRRNAEDLVASRQWFKALREMARDDGRWQPSQLARFVLTEFAPGIVADRFRSLRGNRSSFADELRAVGISPNSDAGRRLQAARDELRTKPEWNPADHRLKPLAGAWLTVGLDRYDRVAARHGIEVRHPMTDKRMVDFCLSLPAHQLQHNGWSKWILRQAFADALPDSVIWRPKEYVGVGPASNLVVQRYGPVESVKPPHPALFDAAGSRREKDDLGAQWKRHVVSTWWKQHAP